MGQGRMEGTWGMWDKGGHEGTQEGHGGIWETWDMAGTRGSWDKGGHGLDMRDMGDMAYGRT